MNIYVGNLDFKVKEEDLQGLFEAYGTLISVNIITDKYSGRSKGFGFIEMEDSEATNAIEKLHGSSFESRDLVVNEARPKKTDY